MLGRDDDDDLLQDAEAYLRVDQNQHLSEGGQAALSDIVNDLIDALNEFAPEYGYFGAHPGDGSDYGFWLHEDWQQSAKDDDVLFVDDLANVPADYEGMVCVVNDHGNASLYMRSFIGTDRADDGHWAHREIWSVV